MAIWSNELPVDTSSQFAVMCAPQIPWRPWPSVAPVAVKTVTPPTLRSARATNHDLTMFWARASRSLTNVGGE